LYLKVKEGGGRRGEWALHFSKASRIREKRTRGDKRSKRGENVKETGGKDHREGKGHRKLTNFKADATTLFTGGGSPGREGKMRRVRGEEKNNCPLTSKGGEPSDLSLIIEMRHRQM